MSGVYQLPDRKNATAKACEWLVRLERGLTDQENRELRGWLAADSENAAALMESASLWDRMNSLSRLADLFPKPLTRQARHSRLMLAIAASVLVAVTAGLFTWLRPDAVAPPPTRVATPAYDQLFETAIGEHSAILLPDGSELTLNTNSRARAIFTESDRRIRLERGEAFVNVAHDETRLFTVWAANCVIRAVGTAFNVEIKEDHKVEVIVAKGKVMIGIADADADGLETAWLDRLVMPVEAGQRILVEKELPKVEAIETQEIDVNLSWREGNLVFRGERLADALEEIGRYTRIQFIIDDEALKSILVAGHFRAGDVDGLLSTLRANFNISYEHIDLETIVLKGE